MTIAVIKRDIEIARNFVSSIDIKNLLARKAATYFS